MTRTEAATNNSKNATSSSIIVPSKAEGVALWTAFILTFVFVVVENLFTIALFVVNSRSLFLVINMVFADLMFGSVSPPLYICVFGSNFEVWKGGWSMSLPLFYTIVDIFFFKTSFISAAFLAGERLYICHLLAV